MSETYKSVILKHRAKRLRVAGPPETKVPPTERLKLFVTKTISRPIYMMTTEPIVMLFDIYNAFNFGLLNAFFAAFSWVFKKQYHFGLVATGLTYVGQAVGSIAGLLIMLYIYYYYWAKESERAKQDDRNAKMSPDKRLIIAKIAAPLLPTG